MIEILCPRDNEIDLILVEYIKQGNGLYEAIFECRQCGTIFSVYIDENELNFWR